LKILQINDVYEIDNFPHFFTCKKEESQTSSMGSAPSMTIAVLPGDFVAPSLLSSLD